MSDKATKKGDIVRLVVLTLFLVVALVLALKFQREQADKKAPPATPAIEAQNAEGQP